MHALPTIGLQVALAWACAALPLPVGAAGEALHADRHARWTEDRDALTDHLQNLQWTRTDNGADISQPEAMAWCQQKGQGWRLPSRTELERLYDSGAPGETTPCRNARCKVPATFTLSSYFYWSAQVDERTGQVWYIYLHTGHPQRSPSDFRLNARALCVRPTK